METKTALAEMVRESIVRHLKKQNVAAPEHISAVEIDKSVSGSFHFAMDLFEQHDGHRMERELFSKLELTPQFFNTMESLAMLAGEVNVGSHLGRLVAYSTFLAHVCVHRVKSGVAVDDAYLDMLTSSVDSTGGTLEWEEICNQLKIFRTRFTAGYGDN